MATVNPETQASFTRFDLQGEDVTDPTSLQFGPDGRLYVAQVNGTIKAYTIAESATGYQVTNIQTIDLVRTIPNHNDDGSLAPGITTRQVTGLLATGTAANPVLYVSSSDPRVGGGTSGTDTGLDTNSGTISRLTLNSSGAWEKVDLVRGLPRSEQNHSTNGMQHDAASQTLYLAIGGSTNAGAPSTRYGHGPEYAYSSAILAIDLAQLAQLPVQGGAQPYIYNLPTLDDPTRPNNSSGGEANDPFGGNDGLNQARLDPTGPVQIYSPGYRNPYDLVRTQAGQLYTIDNGAGEGGGGYPVNEGTANVTNQPSETGFVNNLDNLHLVTEGFYGGHPNPIRANPTGAGLYTSTGQPITPLPANWPPVPANLADSRQGDFRQPGVEDGALQTWDSSTNGLTEYTAGAFGGALRGDLLTVSFDGNLYRIQLNAAGTAVDAVTFLAIGGTPLDVTARGDGVPFAGTIWVATYGSDGIAILRPASATGPNEVTGTPVSETLNGTAGRDRIVGLGGNDLLNGLGDNDLLEGNEGNDRLDGGTGADGMAGGPGDDVYIVDNAGDTVTEIQGAGVEEVRASVSYTIGTWVDRLTLVGTVGLVGTGNGLSNILTGGAGNDRLDALGGNDTLDGAAGTDTMVGGTGDDVYLVNATGDQTIEAAGAGTDTVRSTIGLTLASNIENLTLLGTASNFGTGNGSGNLIIGNGGGNFLTGLSGNDTLRGEGGADVLTGGPGLDLHNGGAGADRFDFNGPSESLPGSGRDVVQDFVRSQGDRIDLATIDADTDGTTGNQGFSFIGGSAFGGIDGQLRFAGGIVQGDTNGDRIADLEIQVTGLSSMISADFIL